MAIELIAEVSSNHGGNLALAKEFIWRFAEAGATFVKFQHTRVKHLRPDDPQYEWFTKAEFSVEQFAELKAECERAGTKFLTTVFNATDVPEAAILSPKAIKIGSGEAGQEDLVMAVKRGPFQRVFVSDGIVPPLGHAHERLACATRYPAPHGCVPLKFGLWTGLDGWSDHCVGLESCQVAILRGARIIEKHVCLPNQARPVKCYEASVEEFRQLRAFADEDPQRFIGRWQYA